MLEVEYLINVTSNKFLIHFNYNLPNIINIQITLLNLAPFSPKMMKSVQHQKIHQTIQLLFKYYNDKDQFMKQNIPIQQQLIRKTQATAELTLSAIGNIQFVLKQERQCIQALCDSYEKNALNNAQKFKLSEKKNPNQQFGAADWNRNITRVLQSMSSVHIAKLNSIKNYYKLVDYSYQQISKQEMRYRSQLKYSLKQITAAFTNIDSNEKEQNKVLTKLVKQSKSKQLKQSLYFLTEVKKAQGFMYKQFEYFVDRNKKILDLVKNVVKNQKKCSKKVKQILTNLFQKKKDIFKQNAQEQKLLGLLTVMEDGVQQSRQLYLQKTLISHQLLQKMSRIVPPQKSKIHHMMKYLSLEKEQLEEKYSFFAHIRALSSNLAFKNFPGVSLAQGWIITSYTPSIAYLTFDHYLIIYDTNGNLLKKILSASTRVNKVGDQNVVYLEEKKKGIFSDSKQQYQLKFDNTDRMQQFILFMQNQIN